MKLVLFFFKPSLKVSDSQSACPPNISVCDGHQVMMGAGRRCRAYRCGVSPPPFGPSPKGRVDTAEMNSQTNYCCNVITHKIYCMCPPAPRYVKLFGHETTAQSFQVSRSGPPAGGQVASQPGPKGPTILTQRVWPERNYSYSSSCAMN